MSDHGVTWIADTDITWSGRRSYLARGVEV